MSKEIFKRTKVETLYEARSYKLSAKGLFTATDGALDVLRELCHST